MRQALRQQLGLAALLCALPGAARADGLSPPERLTAGASDQLLGQLSADGTSLYYASTARALSQIYWQARQTGAAKPLFEETADATWPRLSPDGKRLLYISYQRDAAGDLCVRDLVPGHPDQSGERRCLEDPAYADLQATWMPDGRSVLLLGRKDLHGELELRRVSVAENGGALRAEPFLGQLAGPAVSPDGRWLAYIPVARRQSDVGPSFAFRQLAGPELLLQRLGPRGAEGEPRRLRFNLPGLSGQPAFSPDGRFLYFTQFLNDTSADGSIDGRDHGVLFRVPFDVSAAAAPVPAAALSAPLQLSSAAWNCQYPAPSAAPAPQPGLIATCAFEGSLDVYAMPLDGAVPAAWDEVKLRDELRSSQDRWEQLLLQSRLLTVVAPAARAPLLFDMTRQHLGLREYQSASFYARQLEALGGAQGAMGSALLMLIDHRREERALDRGQLSSVFVKEGERRIAQLAGLTAGASATGAARALAALVESEILDTLGRKGEALAALRRVSPAAESEPIVLHLYGERARDQLRPLNDDAGLLAAYRALATHKALRASERLGYGAAFVQELGRGRGAAEARRRLEAERARTDPRSDLGFRLELEGWLQQLRPDNQEPVRKGVFDLYGANSDPDRRRALIVATVGRAAAQDSEYVSYNFATTWASGLPLTSAERRYAVRLYEQIVLSRAYVEWSRQGAGAARSTFFGVTKYHSLEAHIGFIDTAKREGKQDVESIYADALRRKKIDEAEHSFVQAYLRARALPDGGPELERAIAAALAELKAAQDRPAEHMSPARLTQHVELQHLWGYLEHRRYLATRDSAAAQIASSHYLLALDLARDNPRYRAAILGQLGLLQDAVGNHRVALGYLEERGKMPFVDGKAQLRHQLALGRARFHADRAKEGAEAAEQALAMVQAQKELESFRPLVLDRAALYHLAAGDFATSLRRYRELAPLRALAPPRDRLALHLGRAAAAVGLTQAPAKAEPGAAAATTTAIDAATLAREALAELDGADRILGDGVTAEALAPPGGTAIEALGSRRLIVLGLRAQAQRALGDLAAAERALQERGAELERRLKRRNLDEDELELARTEAGLASLACLRKDLAAALRHVQAGLQRADAFSARTGTPLHETGLGLLDAYAQLHLFGKVAAGADLGERLERAHGSLQRLRTARWVEGRGRVELYRALLRLGPGPGAAAGLRREPSSAMLLRALASAQQERIPLPAE